MRDYGKVHTIFWASDTLRNLNADAKLLALYLLTSPHTNMSGAFRLPDAYACEDLGWTPERLRKGFETVSEFALRDAKTGWVWIPKFLQFNRPENPNQWKAVAKLVALVPDSVSFKRMVSETVPEPFRNSPVPAPVPVSVPEGGVGETKPAKRGRAKAAPEVTLTDWIAGLGDLDAVPADDPIFDWAGKVGIPRDWIGLAWWVFEGRYTGDGQGRAKTYADWRATFRNAVREDWLKLWRANADGFVLTTAGQQAQRERQA